MKKTKIIISILFAIIITISLTTGGNSVQAKSKIYVTGDSVKFNMPHTSPKFGIYNTKVNAWTTIKYYKKKSYFISNFNDIEIHATGEHKLTYATIKTIVYNKKGKKIKTVTAYKNYRKDMIDATGVQMRAYKNTQKLKIPKGGKVVTELTVSLNNSLYYNAISKKYKLTSKFK